LTAFAASSLRAQDTNENAEFKLAINLYNDGLYGPAEKQFKVFIEKFPAAASGIEARYYLGLIQLKVGKYKEARSTFQDFAIRYPDNTKAPDAWWQAAECFVAEHNYAEAASLFARLKTFHPKSPRAPEALLRASQCFLKAGDTDNARLVLTSLLSEYPGSDYTMDAEYQLGVLLIATDEFERALVGLRRVSENSTRPDLRAKALVSIGIIQSRIGNREDAELRFRDVIGKYPGTPAASEAALHLAELQRQLGNMTDAAQNYALVARDTSVLVSIRQEAFDGMAECAIAQNDFKSAAGAYAELFAALPREAMEPGIRFKAAKAMQSVGDYAAAQKQLERLLEDTLSGFDLRKAIAALARNAAASGNLADAERWYRLYLDRYPADAGAPYALMEQALIAEQQYKNYTQARELYAALTDRYPSAPNVDAARLGVARCLEQAGRHREALDMYRQFLVQYPASRYADAARKTERTLGLFQRSPADDAVVSLARIVSTMNETPNSPALDILLGRLYLEDLKDYDEAERCFAAAEKKGVTGDDADRVAHGRVMAAIRRAQKSGAGIADAVKRAQDFIAAHPSGALRESAAQELYLLRSDGTTAAETEAAARDYLAAVQARDAGAVHCVLGDALRMQGKHSQAEQEFTAVLSSSEISDETADAYYGRGLARYAQQNFTGAVDDLRQCEHLRPGGRHAAQALLAIGGVQVRIGQDREAWHTYEKLLQRFGYSVEADSAYTRMIPAMLRTSGKEEAAALALARFRKVDENPFMNDDVRGWALYQAGVAMAWQKDLSKAKRMLQTYLARFPNGAQRSEVLYMLGRIYRDEGKPQLAAAYLRQAGEMPGNVRAGREAADLMLEQGQYQEAIREYERIASGTSAKMERSYALSRIVVALYRDGKAAEAAMRADAFKKEFQDAQPVMDEFELERGKLLLHQKKYDDAMDAFDEVQDSDTPALSALGLCWKGKTREAKNESKKAEEIFLEVLKDHPGTEAAMEAALTMGRMAMRAEKYDVAATYFKSVVEMNSIPQAVLRESLGGLISCYDELDMWDAAIEMTRRFIAAFPNDATVFRKRVNMGVFYYQLRYFDQAVTHLQSILPEASQDDQAEIRYYIGECYFYKGDYTQASLEFLKVPYLVVKKTEIDWRALAYHMTGQCYEKQNRLDDALEMHRKILELKDADPRDRALAEKEINRIKALLK
jgi:TolA-binding protein